MGPAELARRKGLLAMIPFAGFRPFVVNYSIRSLAEFFLTKEPVRGTEKSEQRMREGE